MKINYLMFALVFLILFSNLSQACDPYESTRKCQVSYLYLYEKDPVTWDIISNGSWGKMKYKSSGEEFEFVFNGHNLTPKQNYTLIYYPDPWPGNGLICLGVSTVNQDGNIYIAESLDTDNLPAEYDINEGAKIWLVLSSDVDCENSKMIGWNPNEYLFEHNLIHFLKTQIDASQEKCSIKTKEVETTDEESEENEYIIDIKELSLIISKVSIFLDKFLDKLIERFPIIEKILQQILFWIYYKIATIEP